MMCSTGLSQYTHSGAETTGSGVQTTGSGGMTNCFGAQTTGSGRSFPIQISFKACFESYRRIVKAITHSYLRRTQGLSCMDIS